MFQRRRRVATKINSYYGVELVWRGFGPSGASMGACKAYKKA